MTADNKKADWTFGKEIVPIFDEHVRKNVPMYDEIHRLITDISGWFIEDNTTVYDIGTSTGEVIWNLTGNYPTKTCAYVGIDNSTDMFAKVMELHKQKESQGHSITFLEKDIQDSEVCLHNASLITSVLTLQFIPKANRSDVLRKIYEGLRTGGGFILVEKVIGMNAHFNEMWVELYHELKLRNGMTEKEIMDKARSIRGVLQPLTLEENITLLKEAGFTNIDVFFKWTNFAGIVAMK